MKNIVALLFVAFVATAQAADSKAADIARADEAKAEKAGTKEVCHDVMGKDNKPVKNKDGSTKQQCKTIKIHKKHEGTEIPPKK